MYAERGVSSASIEAIAERAGVTKPTVYAYFDGKEALFEAVNERVKAFINSADWRPYQPGRPAEEQLLRILDKFFEEVLKPERGGLFRALFAEFGRRGKAPPDEDKRGHLQLAQWLQEAKLSGTLSKRDCVIRSDLFFKMLLGTLVFPPLVECAEPFDTRTRRRHLRHAIRFLFDSLS